MPRWSHLAAGAAAAFLLVAAPASAAYAPKLSIRIDPATPSTPPAIASTITQAAGETPNRTVRLSFPAGFTAPSTPVQLGTCTTDQEAARACPDASQVGSADATASVLGLPVALRGTVHYGGVVNNRIKLIVFLDNATLGQHQTIEGFVALRPSDAGFDTIFDGLPDVLTTSFTLSLDGAPRSMVVNPVKCGDYTFTGAFTSQRGEQAGSSSTVSVSGCRPPALVVSPLSLSTTHPRAGRGATLEFQLSEPAAVVVSVKHGGRRVLTYRRAGRAGSNAVRRVGRSLRPGHYSVRVAATTADGRGAARRATLVVRRAG